MKKVLCGFLLIAGGVFFMKGSGVEAAETGAVSGSISVEGEEMRYLKDDIRILFYEKENKELAGQINIDDEGNFYFAGLPLGEYVVRIEGGDYGSIYYENSETYEGAQVISLTESNLSKEGVDVVLDKEVKAGNDVVIPVKANETEEYSVSEGEEEKKSKGADVTWHEDYEVLRWISLILGVLVLGELVVIVKVISKKDKKTIAGNSVKNTEVK